MPIARLDHVSLAFGRRALLEEASLNLRKGERTCLLGRNGEGKTSLLQLLMGRIVPDAGEVWVRPGAKVASLEQQAGETGQGTVREIVLSGLVDVGIDQAWQADLQADQIIARLQLDPDAPMRLLSGGWRRRALLGKALASAPDLLLLDEPTNHLDIDAIRWLEQAMLEFKGALLFVSHDRAFVRRLAMRIVELDRGKLRTWPGSYDEYVSRKRAALEEEARHAALFDKKLAQEEVWIRQGIEARRTRNEGRVRALQELRRQRLARRERLGEVQINPQQAGRSGKLVFEAEHVSHTFGAQPLIKNFSVRIMRGDRIGIIGPNGCGKSTLIKLLVGELEPESGKIRRGTQLACAYFDQQREQLDPEASIIDNVTGGNGDTVLIDGKPRHASGYLRDFLFSADRLQAPVSMLSGGERNRLLLARLFARPSNVLIMDEPTNDLDVETLELLEEMVGRYQGTLLLVSHDRAFIDHVVTSTLVFEGGGEVVEYVGGFSDWLRQHEARGAQGPPISSVAKATGAASAAAAPPKARRLSHRERIELAAFPALIDSLEQEQQGILAAVADPQLFKTDPERAATQVRRLAALQAQLEAAYARWAALES